VAFEGEIQTAYLESLAIDRSNNPLWRERRRSTPQPTPATK
jgi:hypothetical protein